MLLLHRCAASSQIDGSNFLLAIYCLSGLNGHCRFSLLSIKEISCIKRLVVAVESRTDTKIAKILFDDIFTMTHGIHQPLVCEDAAVLAISEVFTSYEKVDAVIRHPVEW